jgi:hypothetical protein
MKQAKRRAAALDVTLTSMIEDGLRLVLATPAKEQQRPLLPRVSRAAGKVLVYFSDSSALLEILDRQSSFEKLR